MSAENPIDSAARALARNGQLPESAKFFENALALNAGIPEVHLDYALALEELGLRDKAIGHLREAVRLRPGFEQALVELRRLTGSK
jgi:tetratricopeptide (TPR) repeat protein